jgi:arylsulfatase A-like enzyme
LVRGGRSLGAVGRAFRAREHARVRRWALACTLASALVPTTGCSRTAAASERRANVVVIALDTTRADHLGCYGYGRGTSPNIDRFARESFVFEQAISAAPWTAPALISLMTSLYPAVHGVRETPHDWRMSEKVVTLAEILKSRGYATAAFTEGGYARGDFGLDQGFDLYPANPEDTTDDHSILKQASRIVANTNRTVDWLRARDDQPFFLFFHTYEVHAPYRAPDEYVRRFEPAFDENAEHETVRRIIETWNATRAIDCAGYLTYTLHQRRCHTFAELPKMQERWKFNASATAQDCGKPGIFHEAAFQERLVDLYDAGIVHADEQVQRILETLRERRELENTIVVIVSDHGEGLGQHDDLEHGLGLYPEILHVVLILRVPESLRRDLPAAARIEPLVRTVDVVPTLLDLLGIRPTGLGLQGKSLVPIMRGAIEDRVAFSHARTIAREEDKLEGIRSGPWRMIWDRGSETAQLFELSADPKAEHDVARAHTDVVSELRTLLDEQRARDATLRQAIGPGAQAIQLGGAAVDELRGLGYIGSENDSASDRDAR